MVHIGDNEHMATQSVPHISEEEYLRRERAAEYKSEYVHGEVFAMSGGTRRHSRVAVNWSGHLLYKLRGGRCEVFSSDMRVRTGASGSYVYPDVSVACGENTSQTDDAFSDILLNPRVVIEVLSPSTTNYDRGQKFELYREIPSLEEYILTHTNAPHVEHFARQADGSWIFREYKGMDGELSLPSIGCSIAFADIYEGIF